MGEKYNLDFDDDEQVNYPSDLNDEILQAPWNTTRAYLGALKGKCLMQIFGVGGKGYPERCSNLFDLILVKTLQKTKVRSMDFLEGDEDRM